MQDKTLEIVSKLLLTTEPETIKALGFYGQDIHNAINEAAEYLKNNRFTLKDAFLNNLSTEALIAELKKRGVQVKNHVEKPHDIYLVTIDHVEGPCTQLCDTIGNAKAFVFGHITSYDTFEEFDAALKGSIDAIDGVIDYSIVKQEPKEYVVPEKHEVKILFGERPSILDEFSFDTEAELLAFYRGLEAMNGWNDYRHIEDLEDEDYEHMMDENPELYEEVCAISGMKLCSECDGLFPATDLDDEGRCPDCQNDNCEDSSDEHYCIKCNRYFTDEDIETFSPCVCKVCASNDD